MYASGRDIIMPDCLEYTDFSYDLNAWTGDHDAPTADQLTTTEQGGLYITDGGRPKTMFITDMRRKQMGEFVELVSVGGTVLFVRAEVHLKGAIFPPYAVIGTLWNRTEGWDGLETEGICYIARSIGYKCWAMPYEITKHN
jgi:hypothetical protein